MALLTAESGFSGLGTLMRKPEVAGLDLVREGRPPRPWLVWASDPDRFRASLPGFAHGRGSPAESLVARLNAELSELGLDAVADRPSRWCTVGWANGLRLALEDAPPARDWSDRFLAEYVEASATHDRFREEFGHQMATGTDLLTASRATFDALGPLPPGRAMGTSIALGIRCVREPDLATTLAIRDLGTIMSDQRFLGERLLAHARFPGLECEPLLSQVVAFQLPGPVLQSKYPLIALRRLLRRAPRCARNPRVRDTAPEAFAAGYRMTRCHPARVTAMMDEVKEDGMRRLFRRMHDIPGWNPLETSPESVTGAARWYLKSYFRDFQIVGLVRHRALFRVATAFRFAFWMGIAVGLTRTRHPRALIPDRN